MATDWILTTKKLIWVERVSQPRLERAAKSSYRFGLLTGRRYQILPVRNPFSNSAVFKICWQKMYHFRVEQEAQFICNDSKSTTVQLS